MKRLCDRNECRLTSRTNNVYDERRIFSIGTDSEIRRYQPQLEIWHHVFEGQMLLSKLNN
jgi:hypothetical protein